MRIFDSKKFQNIVTFKNNLYKKKYIKLVGILTFGFVPFILFQKQILTDTINYQIENVKDIKNYQSNYVPKWEIIHLEKEYKQDIIWEKIKDNSNI